MTTTSWPRRLELASLGVILVLGAVHLPYPFGGDQALFTIGARELDRGAVLYRDFWDFKQPAIFWFYWLAGRLFGFDEVGVHALELVYFLLLAAVLLLTLRAWLRKPFVLALVPLLTVGHYYVVSDWWHLTQVEGLVGLPLYLAAWLTARPVGRATPWWLFLGGVMGGVVLLFKLMFLPIVLVFVLTAFGECRRSTPKPFGRTLGKTLIPMAGGMMVPAAAALAACLWTASLEVALWTWFAFPLDVLREIPTPSRWRLLAGLSWFAQGFSWLAALAVLGAVVGVRRRDPLAVNLIGWCGVGLSLILAQTQSWWAYHYHLLGLPLGLLAALALDEVWERGTLARIFADSPRSRAVLLVALALCFLPSGALMIRKVGYLLKEAPAWQPEARQRYREALNAEYETASQEVAFLIGPGSLPGPIFVFGNPLYYLISGRRQAIALNGWFMEVAPAAQWREATRQLGEARPPYMFVASLEEGLIRQHSKELAFLITTAYRPLRHGPRGTWYVRATERAP